MKQIKGSAGFTLIELLVVIAILGIIGTIAVIQVFNKLDEAKQKTVLTQIKTFGQALDMYRLKFNCYPEAEQGLKALIEKPTVGKIPGDYPEGGFIQGKEIAQDPWDNDYIYERENCGKYKIISYGQDGQPGGTGLDKDISSDDTKVE